MVKTKGSREDVSDFFDKVTPGLTIRSHVWRPGLGSESDCFLDGQGREMNIVLGRVLDITTIMSGDLLRGERAVSNIALNIVVCVTLVCEYFEKCRASGSWTAQYD